MKYSLLLVFFSITAISLLRAEDANDDLKSSTYRLYDGITAFVSNEKGKAFTVEVDVRDLNFLENGPREVLLKIYDPDGKAIVRKVIADDGITSGAYQHATAAFDHEAWYYVYCRAHGAEPMVRWSSFSEPKRLAALAKRSFNFKIPEGKPGVYRVLLAGSPDHYATLRIDPELSHGIAGHPTFIHGHGKLFSKSYLYVPKGATGLFFVAGEWDKPRSRTFTIKAPDGKVIFSGNTLKGYAQEKIQYETPGKYDDKVLTLEISDGPGDFLLELRHGLPKDPEVKHRGFRSISAVLAPDEKTARTIRNGAIAHDGKTFWHGYQIRLHEWLKKKKAEEFVVKNKDGKEIKTEQLPQRDHFLNVNGNHWRPPPCDKIMHSWSLHKNPAALNLAIKDLIAGLRSIGPNDHVSVGGPFANMGYEFSNYAWQYWRPGWRIIQQSNASKEIKALLREGLLIAGDRLAFCRGWARVNGNSFALIPTALKYCSEATQDPIQKQLFDTYLERFLNGGWGKRSGIGPSGPVQEGFAYAYHYGSYPMRTWKSVLVDFPKEKRFKSSYDRMRTWFSYTLGDERIAAGPWSSRTHYYPQWSIETEGPFAWKGLPGPDFTVSVNQGNEWFAARRKGYYALTYHGRLSPTWNGFASAGLSGYGGGMICQIQIPGKGPVIASTLNDQYGKQMDPSQWPNFHLHTAVGTCADGRPLISGDSEHFDAKLVGNQVSSSGDLRNATIKINRNYVFEDDAILCKMQLDQFDEQGLLNLWTRSSLHGRVRSVFEMIPFVPNGKKDGKKTKDPTMVSLKDESGKDLGPIEKSSKEAKTITIDRGGFGARIELEKPLPISRGTNSTILIEIVDEITPASDVHLEYRIIPFGG